MNIRTSGYIIGAVIIMVIVGIGISFVSRSTSDTGPSNATGTDANTQETVDAQLFYPNQTRAPEGADECSGDILAPITVSVLKKPSVIENTVQALINRNLTADEINEGFTSEFPHDGFKLVSVEQNDGTLTLTFTEVPGFTTGGSCRVQLLREQITRSVNQFEQVSDVVIEPETLFQP